jgi:hypothetical protein
MALQIGAQIGAVENLAVEDDPCVVSFRWACVEGKVLANSHSTPLSGSQI